jgi:hypothetical protein
MATKKTARKKPERLRLMQRVRHAKDDLMIGRVLSTSADDKRVLVQWDGGVEQWVPRSQLRP